MDWKPEIEKAVRDVMDGWAASFPDSPISDFGKAVTFVSIAEKPSFVVSLHTLYDVRLRPTDLTKPYSAEIAPTLANKTMQADNVDLWQFPSPLKKELGNQKAEIEIPGSFRAVSCGTCDGTGHVTCVTCSGNKTVPCPECQGEGKKPCDRCVGRGKLPCQFCKGKGIVPGGVRDGQAQPEVQCARCNGAGGSPCDACVGKGSFPCTGCQAKGRLICSNCQGRGNHPCKTCNTTGKIVRGLVFQIQYNDVAESKIAHDREIPDGLLPSGFSWSKASQRVLEKQGDVLAVPEPPTPEPYLKAAIADVHNKGETGKLAQAGESKIIQQKMIVDRIPVYAVVYRHGGKVYDAWLTAIDNKAVAKESPFKDYAREQAMKAMTLSSQGRHEEAQGILAKATAMAGGDLGVAQVQKASHETTAREFLAVHQIASGLAGIGAMALLGWISGPSRHVFWPVFSFGVGALAAAFMAGLALAKTQPAMFGGSGSRRLAISLVLSLGCAAIAFATFSAVGPPRRLDSAEFSGLIAGRFPNGLQPENLSPEDVDFIKFNIQTFEPLGVDVSAAKQALLDGQRMIEEAKARQAAAEAAMAEEERRKAAEAAKVQKEIAAAKKTQGKNKKKPAKSTKKKKKSSWFGR